MEEIDVDTEMKELKLMSVKIKKERTNVLIKALTIFFFQVALCIFLF